MGGHRPVNDSLTLEALLAEIRACQVCAAGLAALSPSIQPRPVVQFSVTARLVIIGQAPGTKVYESGIPWNDASGDRLRDWLGFDKALFYDAAQVALMPMGFCYPGTGKTGDLPPRPECAPLWHDRLLAQLSSDALILLVGSYAQKRYLPAAKRQTMSDIVRHPLAHGDTFFPLPHPSWRSGLWMTRNPWFETDVIPLLRARVAPLKTL